MDNLKATRNVMADKGPITDEDYDHLTTANESQPTERSRLANERTEGQRHAYQSQNK